MGRHTFFTTAREGKLQEYVHWHDNIFPEVCAGLRAAGITQLTIHNLPGTDTLVMSIQTAGDIDLGKATGPDSRYYQNPRCREWEELMKTSFHHGWTEMKEIHASDRQWNTQLGLELETPEAVETPSDVTTAPPRFSGATKGRECTEAGPQVPARKNSLDAKPLLLEEDEEPPRWSGTAKGDHRTGEH